MNVRMDSLSKRNLDHYFGLLKTEFDKYDFYAHPEAIYNMDETGVPLEPRPPKVIARKVRRKYGKGLLERSHRLQLLGVAVQLDRVYHLSSYLQQNRLTLGGVQMKCLVCCM